MIKKKNLEVIKIFFRYLIITLVGFSAGIFYFIFNYPTRILTYFLLSLFYPTDITESLIYFNSIVIELIPACIATSAYFLLFILVLSTRNIKVFRYFLMFLSASILFLLFNVLRIVLLSLIYGSPRFEFLHFLLWNILSVVGVILIWFFISKIFKVKTVPFYSDFKYVRGLSK